MPVLATSGNKTSLGTKIVIRPVKIMSWNLSVEGQSYCTCFCDVLFSIKHASLGKEKNGCASVLSTESNTQQAYILG